MTTWVALLRGINVGRARPVGMANLRDAAESLGFHRVRTLLRSGNLVFEAPTVDPESVVADLERALSDRFAMSIDVVVRTADELDAVVARHPLPEAATDGSRLHVLFLGRPLTGDGRDALDPSGFHPDEVRLITREVYVHYRHGMSGSKTAERLFHTLRMPATDRNWNTVGRLLRLARDGVSASA